MQTTNPSTGFPTSGSTSGSNGSESAINRAGSSAHGSVDEAAGRIKPVIDRVASSAHQAVDKAVGVAVPAAEWLGERGQSLRHSQDRMITETRHYVTTNPLKAVGIALAAGLLLGRLMR